MLSERQQNHLFKRLGSNRLNNTCADCYVKGATWTSVDFGVFVCINCSGCHRSFGMHITRVRSTKLDSWSREDAKLMELVGNEVANSYFLKGKNKRFLDGSPLSFGNSDNRRDHIKKKYIQKAFAAKDIPSPVEFVRENNFNLTKAQVKEFYLEQNQSNPKTAKATPKVTANRKKPINLKGMNKSAQKKPKTDSPSDNDLLNFDLNITPANQAPTDLWDFSTSNKALQVPKKISEPSSDNLLDFNFGSETNKVSKGSEDLLNLGGNSTSNGLPKPPSKNPQMFNSNPTFMDKVQNDKYNCLSFNNQPNRNFFYSNPSYGNNGGMNNQPDMWGGMGNGVHTQSQRNPPLNSWNNGGNFKKSVPVVRDKYDVFDMCLANNRNGYFN